jgi:hypothetical protein
MGFVVMGLLLLPRFAWTHTPGVSTANFEVLPGGSVEAHLAFSSAEPLGRLTPTQSRGGEVAAAAAADQAVLRDDMRAFFFERIDVAADGNRCPATFRDASLAPPDGVAIEASYACPLGAAEVAVTLYYLSELPPGHREVVRIVAGTSSTEAILAADRRGLVLKVPGGGGAPRGRAPLLALLGLAATTLALYLLWRTRFRAS